jgi:hypothetical protein
MKKAKHKGKSVKSFADLHGSKSDVFKGVSGQQLGHDQQLPVNPPTPGGSPMIDPGSAGHPIGQSMQSPYGEDFY